MWDEEGPAAIINDTVVKEGDSLGNYTVLEITESQVVVADDQKHHVLKVNTD